MYCFQPPHQCSNEIQTFFFRKRLYGVSIMQSDRVCGIEFCDVTWEFLIIIDNRCVYFFTHVYPLSTGILFWQESPLYHYTCRNTDRYWRVLHYGLASIDHRVLRESRWNKYCMSLFSPFQKVFSFYAISLFCFTWSLPFYAISLFCFTRSLPINVRSAVGITVVLDPQKHATPVHHDIGPRLILFPWDARKYSTTKLSVWGCPISIASINAINCMPLCLG